jgi:hypothetical protein
MIAPHDRAARTQVIREACRLDRMDDTCRAALRALQV